jgi:hypothetical protein
VSNTQLFQANLQLLGAEGANTQLYQSNVQILGQNINASKLYQSNLQILWFPSTAPMCTISGTVHVNVPFVYSGVPSQSNVSYVSVGIAPDQYTPPTLTTIAQVENDAWTATLTPTFTGTAYIWVQEYIVTPPEVLLSWSYDKGKTFGNPVPQTVGAQGQNLTAPSWRRLGLGRDVVFQLEWSFPGETALNGAFIDIQVMNS